MSETAAINSNCPHCGGFHRTTCPRIKSIEYYQDGTVKRVEFVPPIAGIPQYAGAGTNPNISGTS